LLLWRKEMERRVRNALPDAQVIVSRRWWGAPVVYAKWSVLAEQDGEDQRSVSVRAVWTRHWPFGEWCRYLAVDNTAGNLVHPKSGRSRWLAQRDSLRWAVRQVLGMSGMQLVTFDHTRGEYVV
jgi:hypothetical protein